MPAHVFGQVQAGASQPSASFPLRWSVINVSRVESWSFFAPSTTGADPDYTFFANRLRLAVAGAWSRVDVGASAQYVQFAGLPDQAFGPGALGTGAVYFDHSGRTDSRGIYLRTLFVRLRLGGGTAVQVGRFPY